MAKKSTKINVEIHMLNLINDCDQLEIDLEDGYKNINDIKKRVFETEEKFKKLSTLINPRKAVSKDMMLQLRKKIDEFKKMIEERYEQMVSSRPPLLSPPIRNDPPEPRSPVMESAAFPIISSRRKTVELDDPDTDDHRMPVEKNDNDIAEETPSKPLDWEIKIQNFFDLYHDENSHTLNRKIEKFAIQMRKELEYDDRVELFDSMLKMICLNHLEFNIGHLIIPIVKMANQLQISKANLFIKDWTIIHIRNGVYGDIENFREQQLKIDKCSDEKIKKSLIGLFEEKKIRSQSIYRGLINLLIELYQKKQYNNLNDLISVGKILLENHSTNPEYYLELVIEFTTKIAQLFLIHSNSESTTRNFKQFIKEFEKTSYDWPKHLDNDRRQLLRMFR